MRMSQGRWIDVTRRIEVGMPVYPGDPEPDIVTSTDHDGISVSRITMLSHCGTHLDLPGHVDARHAPLPEERILRALNGRAIVLGMRRSSTSPISLEALKRGLQGHPPQRLLIRTNPEGESYRALAPGAARWLAGRTLLVGTDALSVDAPGGELSAHRILLGSGTLIIENLLLANATAGLYHLMALPLRLGVRDGAPVRALIRPIRSRSLEE